jgi:hypothetical protein
MMRPDALRARARALRAQAEALAAEADALDAEATSVERGVSVDVDPLIGPGAIGVTAVEWRAGVRRGELRASLIGRRLLARRSDVDAWLACRLVGRVIASAPESGERVSSGDEMDRRLAKCPGRTA